MAAADYGIPLGGCKVNDIVVVDHHGLSGRGEWVGRVTRVTPTQVTVEALKMTTVSDYATGSEAASRHVLKEPVEEVGHSVVFRWAKAQGWYQTPASSCPPEHLARLYTPGTQLVNVSYY